MRDEATLIQPVLHDLADLFARVRPQQYSSPTPCPGYDVGGMRDHVHGWLSYFAQALQDPSGTKERVDPTATPAPSVPAEAAEAVRAAAASIEEAMTAGAGDAAVRFVQASMPGRAVIGMALWEYQVHGWDLARGAEREWHPDEAASELSLTFAKSMLSDEYRGEGNDFAGEVEVPTGAPALARLLGFSGRDPSWRRPAE